MNNPSNLNQVPGISPRESAAFDALRPEGPDSYALYNRKKQEIQYVEELSLNAWPSHMIELYDGWLIRFSHNYTYRTNSVEQVGLSALPVEEKIAYCESVYRKLDTPAHFKINPLADPAFDLLLEQKGYEIRHITEVMTADMEKVNLYPCLSRDYEFENRLGLPSFVHYPEELTVSLSPVITDEWIQGVFHLNGTCEPVLRRIVPSMFKAIPKETIVASVEIEGRMVASGLGIRDRDYVGLYAIYVAPSCRRRHYARAICRTILREAKERGAARTYLQVVRGNAGAKKLYHSLGYEDFYTYWFRSRQV